ncbi:hypothetical protein [Melghirimyces algeriensis]|uniref:Uncharacterized protein n=1 Tax=Melghirimyces algeriensis TaxID=910412 RepID=A0A521B5X0_9BACL|nr:hypothetical protein [Melghirimyces algeriensis]SMO42502.1 hypothetical protein SAMN06264849_101568 [Melghirimyces algeriensis]
MEGLGRRLFASIFISLMAAGLLSLLPALDSQDQGNGEIPAFHSHTEGSLTQETLVNFLLQQPLHVQLDRVDLEQGRLLIRLKEMNPEEKVYNDILTLLYSSFVEVSNVEFIKLQITLTDGRQGLTLYANRSDLADDPQMQRAKKMSAREYIEQTFRLVQEEIPR